jgi:hypothetical protein
MTALLGLVFWAAWRYLHLPGWIRLVVVVFGVIGMLMFIGGSFTALTRRTDSGER